MCVFLALHPAWVLHSSSFIIMAVVDVRGVGIGFIQALGWLSIPALACLAVALHCSLPGSVTLHQ
jgi:hypothetical protein